MRRSAILKEAPIMVVEDDLVQALDLVESLREAGASVVGPICDVDEAVRVARTGRCQGAILDFRLGTRNTMPIAVEFQRRQTPFVIHTGYQCGDQLPSDWPGCRLVSKPANIPKLIRTMAALVRWKRLFSKRGMAQKRRSAPLAHPDMATGTFRPPERASAWPDLPGIPSPPPPAR